MKDIKNLNNWVNWIEESISKKHIKHYESKYFSNIEKIEAGAFGRVFRAKWKNSEQYLALKSFNLNKATVKELVHEVINDKIIFFYMQYIFN
jgi:hypothetical protein